MLRRIAGSPIRGDHYAKADIDIARLGIAQRTPNAEFDAAEQFGRIRLLLMQPFPHGRVLNSHGGDT